MTFRPHNETTKVMLVADQIEASYAMAEGRPYDPAAFISVFEILNVAFAGPPSRRAPPTTSRFTSTRRPTMSDEREEGHDKADALDLARRLLEAAGKTTEGEWRAELDDTDQLRDIWADDVDGEPLRVALVDRDYSDDDEADANARFIALSRTAAPALAQYALDASAELDQLREIVAYENGRRSAKSEPPTIRMQADRDTPFDLIIHGEATPDRLRRIARLIVACAEIMDEGEPAPAPPGETETRAPSPPNGGDG